MALTLQTMREKAKNFYEVHKDDSDERSEAQIFWRDFFDIFGIHVKDVAVFEQAVKKFDGSQGFIDCFWKGKLVIEHKSKGKNLTSAFMQALGYLDTLSAVEKPRYIIVSDFERIRLIDLIDNKTTHIELKDLEKNIQLFKFIYEDDVKHIEDQEELNIAAAELIGKLHDSLKEDNYTGRKLELLLIRILFCAYAEDTGIFKPYQFYEYISNEEEPSRVGSNLVQLFRILNQPTEKRQSSLPIELSDFPYVNGKLFEEQIIPPVLNLGMFRQLKDICKFDWSTISPAIFGSLFQSIMDEDERHNLGEHYTSESNVLKVINSLFMNELWEEFYKVNKNKQKLDQLREKIGNLKFLDPACGCGNFLIIAYRELRLLEYEILSILLEQDNKQTRFNVEKLTKIKLNNFYGIEIKEFPCMITKVAMWFTQHQMDLKYQTLDIHEKNLPLKESANIINDNALRINWEELLEPRNNVYLLGNPPFLGKQEQNKKQKEDIAFVFKEYDKNQKKEIGESFKRNKNIGLIDYVTPWYKKAAEYIQGTEIDVAFVSTSSITEGEQPAVIWDILIKDYQIKINFAHQSFKWSNEAKNNAGVYVIIIGFSLVDKEDKYIFTYETPSSIPKPVPAKHINSYLLDSEDNILDKRRKPLCDVPPINFGNMPNDGGHLLLDKEEYEDLNNSEYTIRPYLKKFIGAKEFIQGGEKYCLWLKECTPSEILKSPKTIQRIEKVKEHRLKSKREKTRELAEFPYLFGEIRQKNQEYIIIPRVSSENREYIPIGFFDSNTIVGDTCQFINNSSLYHFGIITSKMHMTWMRHVCGRLKGDYRYSNTIVYNNFPFPKNVSKSKIEKVSELSQEVLDIRKNYPKETLANLYDPLLMPPKLKKAHLKLDKAVDKCYRSIQFKDDNDRMKFLFDLYEEYTK